MKENREKMKEIISILMESTLYFDIPLDERREIVVRLIERIHWV